MLKGIVAILNADANIIMELSNDDASIRVYAGRRPQEVVDLPAVTLEAVSMDPEDTKTTASKIDIHQMDVVIWSTDYMEATKIAGHVRSALDNYFGEIGGCAFTGIRCEDQRQLFEDDQDYSAIEQRYEVRVRADGNGIQYPAGIMGTTAADYPFTSTWNAILTGTIASGQVKPNFASSAAVTALDFSATDSDSVDWSDFFDKLIGHRNALDSVFLRLSSGDDWRLLEVNLVTDLTGSYQLTLKDTGLEFGTTFDIEAAMELTISFMIETASGGYVYTDIGYDVIMLWGESNMVGRDADYDAERDYTSDHVVQWGRFSPNDGKIILASDPLEHNDTAGATGDIGMGMSFARKYAQTLPANRKVLLVCTAKGGTSFIQDHWNVGDAVYEDAISRVNAAIAEGTNNRIVAVIGEMGGNDGTYTGEGTFQANLDAFITNSRGSITGASTSTPYIMCGLAPDFYNTDAGILACHNIVVDLPNRVLNTIYVSDENAVVISGGDLHKNGDTVRALGERTFEALRAFLAGEASAAQTIPTQILNVTASAQNASALVEWDYEGKSSTYVVEYKLASEPTTWTASSPTASNSLVVSSLTNDALYDFRVYGVNVIGDGPVSATAQATPVDSDIEIGAQRHYLLGSDNASHNDMNGANPLTAIGTAPTGYSGYIKTASGGMHGLECGVPDKASAQTVIAVVRVISGNTIFSGALDQSAGGGGGAFLHASGSAGVNHRGTSGYSVISSMTSGFAFLAYSLGASSQLNYYRDSGGASKATGTTTGTKNIADPIRNIAIGNGYYNVASYFNACDIAELIVFDSEKTETEFDDIYTRSVSRLAERGITI